MGSILKATSQGLCMCLILYSVAFSGHIARFMLKHNPLAGILLASILKTSMSAYVPPWDDWSMEPAPETALGWRRIAGKSIFNV